MDLGVAFQDVLNILIVREVGIYKLFPNILNRDIIRVSKLFAKVKFCQIFDPVCIFHLVLTVEVG